MDRMTALGVALAIVGVAASAELAAKRTGHPRGRPVDAIVVHSLGGPDCQNGARFFRQVEGSARKWVAAFARLPIVSIHYVIGRDGDVQSGIPESMAASHAVGWNQRSVGIELVNNGDGTDPFPTPQIDALIRLVQALRGRHPAIALERVLRHSDVDRTTFPAAVHGEPCTAFRRKLDPGDAFPWDAFMSTLESIPPPAREPRVPKNAGAQRPRR
jgi:N-acetylmuramoyl-L-alanine amidase